MDSRRKCSTGTPPAQQLGATGKEFRALPIRERPGAFEHLRHIALAHKIARNLDIGPGTRPSGALGQCIAQADAPQAWQHDRNPPRPVAHPLAAAALSLGR